MIKASMLLYKVICRLGKIIERFRPYEQTYRSYISLQRRQQCSQYTKKKGFQELKEMDSHGDEPFGNAI